MKSISASEFCRNLRRYSKAATARGSVPISSNGCPAGAFLSEQKYQHYLALKGRETKSHRIDELPSDLITDIESSAYGTIGS